MTPNASGAPLRVALVGYGLAGSVFHAPLVSATDGLVLDTVVTSNEERRAEARAAYPRSGSPHRRTNCGSARTSWTWS